MELMLRFMEPANIRDGRTWTLGFHDGTYAFGACDYKKHRITLSATLVMSNGDDDVRSTMLHEIAHALVGSMHRHDSVWRRMCLSIGGDGEVTCTVKCPPLKYQATCPKCGHISYKSRIPSRRVSCGACCRTFREDAELIYSLNKNYVKVKIDPQYK